MNTDGIKIKFKNTTVIAFAFAIVCAFCQSNLPSFFDASKIQSIMGRNDPVPEKSLENIFKNVQCDGYGCYNVYQSLCRDDWKEMLKRLRNMGIIDEIEYMPEIAQRDIDCQGDLPPKVARLNGITNFSESKGLTQKASRILTQRIELVAEKIRTCQSHQENKPFRCLIPLGGKYSNTEEMSYSDYKQILSLNDKNTPIIQLFPTLVKIIKSEQFILDNVAVSVKAACRANSENASQEPEAFFIQNKCNIENISNADAESIKKAYKEAWDEYNWNHSDILRCKSSKTENDCNGVVQYLKLVPYGNHRIEAEMELDDLLWETSNSKLCGEAKSKADCNGVLLYIKKNPEGRNIDSAKVILAKGEKNIESLIDENDWKDAQSDKCLHPQKGDDCDGVKEYIENHPAGSHLSEAEKISMNSKEKITSLKNYELEVKEAEERKKQKNEENLSDIEELCNITQSLDQVKAQEVMQRRIDAASGTVNLSQKRAIASAKIVLQDRRDEIFAKLKKNGIKFSQKNNCETTADEQ